MKLLLQRVREARVDVHEETVGRIGPGLMVFVGVQKDDDERVVERLAERLVGYRVFSDAQGRMNRDVREAGGALLLVSQFTLAADTGKGRRPSFSSAAEPARAEQLYEALIAAVEARGVAVARGRFGADMQVHLVNDGPVTFLLEL